MGTLEAITYITLSIISPAFLIFPIFRGSTKPINIVGVSIAWIIMASALTFLTGLVTCLWVLHTLVPLL